METHKNLETTHNHRVPPPSSQDFKIMIKNLQGSSHDDDDDERSSLQSSSTRKMEESSGSGRERLKRHRVEMAGRVWIPDIWGQEDLLSNWIDCTLFDSSINNTSIMSAREALIQESTLTC